MLKPKIILKSQGQVSGKDFFVVVACFVVVVFWLVGWLDSCFAFHSDPTAGFKQSFVFMTTETLLSD